MSDSDEHTYTIGYTLRWLDDRRGVLVWSFDPLHVELPPNMTKAAAEAELDEHERDT